MFEVYIEIAFLNQLWDLTEAEQDLVKSFFKRLGPHALVILNLESEKSLRDNEELDTLWSIFFSENIKTRYETNFLDLLNEGKKYNGLKLFFLENGNTLSDDSGYIHISRAHISEKLDKLSKLIETNRFFLALDTNAKIQALSDTHSIFAFKDWKDLNNLAQLPTNSVVIIDSYILSNPDRITNNLAPLLHSILPETYQGEVDILIISENILNYGKNVISETQSLNKMKFAHSKLTSLLSSKRNFKKINISIVRLDRSCIPKDVSFHDRIVYTNYFRILFTSGMDVFINKGQRKQNNSEVIIDSNLIVYMLVIVPEHLKQLRIFLENIVKKQNTTAFYPPNITNHLLNFSSGH